MTTSATTEGSNLGPMAQLRLLSSTYWVSNGIELLERLAYYGLRTVLPIYMLLAVEQGGPQFDNLQKGAIFAWWAAVQSFVPVFSGGYADRFGFKRTIAVSIGLYVLGFVMMSFNLEIGAALSNGASVGVPGHPAVYNAFIAGATLVALGAAVFKPGLQGLIATQVDERTGAFAWGIFYQVVNIGGFLGPILAGYLRVLDWKYVFWACSVIASLNWLVLLAVREPERAPQPKATWGELLMVPVRGVGGILEPRLFAFLAVFSGFWAMFYQLFDLLPVFIEDWVDTSGIYAALAVPGFALFGSTPPAAWDGRIPQEFMVNMNAGMIMLLAFAAGYLTGFFRSMTNMIVGILISALGIFLLGTMNGWATLGAIVVFSIGEMLASPTKMRFVAQLAPPEKKGLYLGYVNATTGIGWSIGSIVAGSLYEEGGDKVVLARRYLVEQVGTDAATVEGLAKTEVMPYLIERMGTSEEAVRTILWTTYEPAAIWNTFVLIGLTSMIGLVFLDAITRRTLAQEEAALIVLTTAVTGVCYGVGFGALFFGLMAGRRVVATVWPASRPEHAAWLAANPWAPGSVVMGVAFLMWIVTTFVS